MQRTQSLCFIFSLLPPLGCTSFWVTIGIRLLKPVSYMPIVFMCDFLKYCYYCYCFTRALREAMHIFNPKPFGLLRWLRQRLRNVIRCQCRFLHSWSTVKMTLLQKVSQFDVATCIKDISILNTAACYIRTLKFKSNVIFNIKNEKDCFPPPLSSKYLFGREP